MLNDKLLKITCQISVSKEKLDAAAALRKVIYKQPAKRKVGFSHKLLPKVQPGGQTATGTDLGGSSKY